MILRGRGSEMLRRWLKSNVVGVLGIGVQLLCVFLLGSLAHMNSLAVTALGVEAAVLHNFFWHKYFTWADRQRAANECTAFWHRLLAFNCTAGVISLGGNLLCVSLLVSYAHSSLLVANCAAIAACSLANFVMNDRFIFRAPSDPAACRKLADATLGASQSLAFRICLHWRTRRNELD